MLKPFDSGAGQGIFGLGTNQSENLGPYSPGDEVYKGVEDEDLVNLFADNKDKWYRVNVKFNFP